MCSSKRGRFILWIAFAACVDASRAATVDPSLLLGDVHYANGQCSLTLTGESEVTYVIEASTNCLNWQAVATNSDPFIERTIAIPSLGSQSFYRATRGLLPVFSVAIATFGEIDFNGFSFRADSYNSADPNYSDSGLYPVAFTARQSDKGHVLAGGIITNSLNTGNVQIKGRARSGPGGTVYVGAGGSIGSKAWVEGANPGVEPGYVDDQVNIAYPAAALPMASWNFTPNGTYTNAGIIYDTALLDSGDYFRSHFTQGVFIGTNAVVRLYLFGNVNLSGTTEAIRVSPGAQLKLYLGGTSFKMAGHGVINDTGLPAAFQLYALSANGAVEFNGDHSIIGTIYAPHSNVALGGGGMTTLDFIGASVSETLTLNAPFYFHFDENLIQTGPAR